MGQFFSVLFQNAFRSIFNKQRFFIVFSSLACFGYVFTLFLELCLQYLGNIPVATLGLGAFFGAYTILCFASVLVHVLLKKTPNSEKMSLAMACKSHWKALWLSLLVATPFFIATLSIGTLVGVILFLNSLPLIGNFLHSILIFVPFLLATASILLFLFSFVSLFFCMPVIVHDNDFVYRNLIALWKGCPLRKIIAFLLAVCPLLLCAWLISDSFQLMLSLVQIGEIHTWKFFIQTLMLVAPIALILSPAVSFFFNLSFFFYEMKLEEKVSYSMNSSNSIK